MMYALVGDNCPGGSCEPAGLFLLTRRPVSQTVRSVVSTLFCLPVIYRNCHVHFRVDTEPVGNAVDVVEITDDLRRDRNLGIIESQVPQCIQVRRRHISWSSGQLDGVVTEGPVGLAQFCRAEVKDQLLGELQISRLQTEVVCMGESSVVAVVDVAHDGGKHLTSSGAQ